MAGFRALAREVRDPRNSVALRRTSLRKCLERFAPYGHRATWHHLCVRTGMRPADRDPDPARLVAALTELEEAREVWLAYEAEFAARRRREKHDGVRQPGAVDDWHRLTWGGCEVVRCADPETHPAAPLPQVLRQVIAAMETSEGPAAGCPVCGQDRMLWHGIAGRAWEPGPVCASCGIVVPRPTTAPRAPALACAR
ncbi:hypothetical protein [Streptomyces sp. NPDC057702]|uniref:hypothetical protein n=1 Tax=unclassified Streptomyces TaxID=2593676 RepID=UPI003676DB6B